MKSSVGHWRNYRAGETEVLARKKKVCQCHFAHDRCHMRWPAIEPGPPRWEAGDWPPFVATSTLKYIVTHFKTLDQLHEYIRSLPCGNGAGLCKIEVFWTGTQKVAKQFVGRFTERPAGSETGLNCMWRQSVPRSKHIPSLLYKPVS